MRSSSPVSYRYTGNLESHTRPTIRIHEYLQLADYRKLLVTERVHSRFIYTSLRNERRKSLGISEDGRSSCQAHCPHDSDRTTANSDNQIPYSVPQLTWLTGVGR